MEKLVSGLERKVWKKSAGCGEGRRKRGTYDMRLTGKHQHGVNISIHSHEDIYS